VSLRSWFLASLVLLPHSVAAGTVRNNWTVAIVCREIRQGDTAERHGGSFHSVRIKFS
jgi:hypothetical protein